MTQNLTISIDPVWEKLDQVREKTEAFLRKEGFSKSQIDALVMTVSELVENAIKYGDNHSGQEKVNITVDIYPKEVIIEVKNKINKFDDKELKKLDENIQWIRGFQNQYQAYIERLKHISAKKLKDGESGLGMVRISYEGQCILDFYVNEDDVLAMSAVYKL